MKTAVQTSLDARPLHPMPQPGPRDRHQGPSEIPSPAHSPLPFPGGGQTLEDRLHPFTINSRQMPRTCPDRWECEETGRLSPGMSQHGSPCLSLVCSFVQPPRPCPERPPGQPSSTFRKWALRGIFLDPYAESRLCSDHLAMGEGQQSGHKNLNGIIWGGQHLVWVDHGRGQDLVRQEGTTEPLD